MAVDYSLFTVKARTAIKNVANTARQCQYAMIEALIMMVSLLQERQRHGRLYVEASFRRQGCLLRGY